MLTFISNNLANIVVVLILIVVTALVIRKLVHDHKAGKTCSSCSGGCNGDCSHCGNHH